MNKAVFLDRDGVINVDKGYVHKVEDFEFVDGIFELCEFFQRNGYLIIVITNQAGIARGYYTEEDFLKLTDWMLKEFKIRGIDIAKVYYCPHHPDFTGPCFCRKPQPGLILKAKDEFDIDLSNSFLIGDKESDIMAGLNAGVGNIIFLSDFESDDINRDNIIVVKNLRDIVKFLQNIINQ